MRLQQTIAIKNADAAARPAAKSGSRLRTTAPPLQAKLTVSQADDRHEREADSIAEQVMRMPDRIWALPGGSAMPAHPSSLQRAGTDCGDEIQRQIQGAHTGSAVSGPDTVESATRRGGRALDPAARSFFEPRFGHDFSAVRVHTDAPAVRSAQTLGALAYTLGRDMVFNSGQYAPHSDAGKRLLAHELAHVVQQGAAVPVTGASGVIQRQTAAEASATVAGPTGDSLLNEWLARHADAHLSADSAWVLTQWPTGGGIQDLNPDFGGDIQGLLAFVAATPGASFGILSYARPADKQHVMHVSQYIRKGWVGYDRYKFSRWPDVAAAGGRAGLLGLEAVARQTALDGISNPEPLAVVWDTGTANSSTSAGSALAAAYHIGLSNPVANGGPTYAWPTGDTTTSRHESGSAVDAQPVVLPNSVVIRRDQARAWPDIATAQASFGAANTVLSAAPDSAQESITVTGLSNVAHRDAFLELFFEVQSAARAGFTDPQHFQAP